MTRSAPIDVLLLLPAWRPRVLLRAQLLESEFTVVATESWPDARQQLLTGGLPRLVIVDLESLPEPHAVLAEIHSLVPADRVLVLGAVATMQASEVRQLGFGVLERPFTIKSVVAAASRALGRPVSP